MRLQDWCITVVNTTAFSPLLRDLHWLRVPERIKFRMAVLVFRCPNHADCTDLARDLQWADMDDSRRRLR